MRVGSQIAQVNQSWDENVKITSDQGRFATVEEAQTKASEVAASDTEDAVVVQEDDGQYHVYGTSEIGKLDPSGNAVGQYELHDFESNVVSFDITQRDQSGNRTGGEVRAIARNGSATASVATDSSADGPVTLNRNMSNFMNYLNPLNSAGDKVQLQISGEVGGGFGWVSGEVSGSAVANVVRGENGSFAVNFTAQGQAGVAVGRKTAAGGGQAEVFGGVTTGATYEFRSMQEVNDFLTYQIQQSGAGALFPNLPDAPDMSNFGPSRTQSATFVGAGVSGSIKVGDFNISGGATFTHQSVDTRYAGGITSRDTVNTTTVSASVGAGDNKISISGSLVSSSIENSPNPNAIGEFKTLSGNISLTITNNMREKIMGGDTDAIRNNLQEMGERLNLRGAGLQRFVNGSMTRVVSAAGNGQDGSVTIGIAVEAQWKSDDMNLEGDEMQHLRLGVFTEGSYSAGVDGVFVYANIGGSVRVEDWGDNLLDTN